MEQKNDVISYLAQLPAQKLHPATVLSIIRKRHIFCMFYKQLLIVIETHKGIRLLYPFATVLLLNMELLGMKSAEEEMITINKIADNLSEARFQFALKCLQTVVQRKPLENVVFCPYSIYEGLFMVYFVSEGHTERHLKRILQLPNISREFLALYHRKERRTENRDMYKGYYDGHGCWIKKSKRLFPTKATFFNIDKCNVFDCSEVPNLMQDINEVLRNEMQYYISHPVELNGLNKNMEFILSSEFRFKGDTFKSDVLTKVPFELHDFARKPRHVISSTLGMFVTEISYLYKTQSLYLLFPAVQSIVTNTWEVDENISGLVERLATKEGSDELRKVLEDQGLSLESVINPDFFELEHELPIDELLEDLGIRQLLEPHDSNLSNFTRENLHLGGAIHRSYIKVTPQNVTAGAVNMFFTKNEATFKSIEGTNYSQYKNSFVLLIYDRHRRDILFTGVMNKNYPLPEVSSAAHTASFSNVVEMK